MPKYTYQSLDKPNSEFRLLQISKDPLTNQPQCSLRKYNLIDCPGYTALSYTWGYPTPTHSVAVDGANIEVRRNLFDFLHFYTTEPWGMDNVKRQVLYWIDQICINQEDLEERSDQVRIMDKIYGQAKSVLVWLGCDPTMLEAARRLRDEKDDDHWAIATLLAHPYFSRIWTIQEVALSLNYPLMVCGGIELGWDLVRFSNRRTEQNLPRTAAVKIHQYARIRERRTLEECIRVHSRGNCHDPRDKMYGLLGLTPERWRVRVDYTKEVLEVYFDAVAALCEELFDLTDPESLYKTRFTDLASPLSYGMTLGALAESMGLPQRYVCGLESFLEHIQGAYLTTKIRNVQYTYTGRLYTTVRAQSSSEQILAPKEVEVSWGSITATRRNPLLRDIIPEMGLQLASTTAESTDGQSGDSVPALDRWWYKHGGEIHYFDCFDERLILHRM